MQRADFAINQITDFIGRYAQQKPTPKEMQAYLPHKVKRLIRIIPNSPAKLYVDDKSDGKFEACYNKGAHQATVKQSDIFAFIYHIQQHKHCAAREHHRPVCVSSGDNLKHTVEYTAKSETKQTFF